MTRLIINQQRAEQKMAEAASQAMKAIAMPTISLPKWGNLNVRHEGSSKR